MNVSVFYPVLFLCALLMAVLPFAVFLGGSNLLGLETVTTPLVIAYAVCVAIVGYVVSFGSFAIFQKSNCDEVKNWKQVALNALLSLGIQFGVLLLILVVPWFRRVVTQLLSPDTNDTLKQTLAYAYYAFWSALLGIGLGGTMSSSCATIAEPIPIPLELPKVTLPPTPQIPIE